MPIDGNKYKHLNLRDFDEKLSVLPAGQSVEVRMSAFGGADVPAEIHDLSQEIGRAIMTLTYHGRSITIQPKMSREEVRRLYEESDK